MDSPHTISIAEIVFAFLALGNIISGLDDLFVDVYYWVSYLARRISYPRRKYPLLSDADLDAVPQKRAAIFVAAWHEEDVIEEMLVTNSQLIDYQNYDFFIACYPNDLPTQEKIDAAAARLPNVHKAVNPQPGPSNKADNLNAAFATLRKQERISGNPYDFIVMHDPEDVLHPLELKLYNYLMTKRRVNMIQTPVFPIETPAQQFTAGSYMDEFAETHTKDIYVREWANGFVPSAGVGTCIARSVFNKLSEEYGDKVFNTNSLTEDYDFGLRLKMSGHKAIFVRQALVRKQAAAAGKETTELIATRAHFPATFKTAVRQRTRWMVGIIFQNWKHFGWTGGPRTRWMLFHDRKGVWANTLVLLNYLFMVYSLIHLLLQKTVWPDLAPLLHEHAWVNLAISLCMTMMLNRMLQRVIATTRIYNFKQGLLAIPRLVWGNIINVTVTFRATRQFLTAEMQGKKIAWDKTQHFFPSHGEVVANQHGVAEALTNAGRTAVARIQEVLTPKPSPDWRLDEALLELRQMIESDIARERAAQATAFVERVRRDMSSLQADVATAARQQRRATPAQPVMVEPHLEVEEMIVDGREPSLSDLLLGRRRVSRQPLSFVVDRNLSYGFSE
ncbi:MAG TPA: glycosyl transferase family protein [Blastocatellia bacterium]|nr:glycosyl transferase family protein [Blastocatellia bacterium]